MLQRNKQARTVMAKSKPRIIRKYANRRLYDTEASRHINKDDVRKLMAEQELGGQPVLSDQMLTQIIRFYDHPMQGMLGSYLQQSFDSFLQQQSTLQEQMQEMMRSGPFAVMKDVAKQNVEAWQAMQKAFLETTSRCRRASYCRWRKAWRATAWNWRRSTARRCDPMAKTCRR